jgi:hypothetical protein
VNDKSRALSKSNATEDLRKNREKSVPDADNDSKHCMQKLESQSLGHTPVEALQPASTTGVVLSFLISRA